MAGELVHVFRRRHRTFVFQHLFLRRPLHFSTFKILDRPKICTQLLCWETATHTPAQPVPRDRTSTQTERFESCLTTFFCCHNAFLLEIAFLPSLLVFAFLDVPGPDILHDLLWALPNAYATPSSANCLYAINLRIEVSILHLKKRYGIHFVLKHFPFYLLWMYTCIYVSLILFSSLH